VQRQNKSALLLATSNLVKKVNYPGLETSPAYDKARKWFQGSGGVVSFELHGDSKQADRFIKSLEIAQRAPSLGGIESLVIRPAATSHAGQSEEELRAMGIAPELIRVSVGIEDSRDLIEDFATALKFIAL